LELEFDNNNNNFFTSFYEYHFDLWIEVDVNDDNDEAKYK